MKRGTLVFLVVLSAGLLLLWKEKEKHVESGGPELAQYPLFPRLQKDRVKSVRIDNIERSVQVKLERDGFGSWFLTDPLPYPAVDSLVRGLLQHLELALGIPEVELNAEEIELDPPLAVLELVQLEEGGERRLRLEVGGLDLDPSRIYVRVPDHGGRGEERIFRTVRTLYTTLDRNPDDYRERRATHLTGQQVTALKRRGEVFLEDRGAPVDLHLDAQLDGRWLSLGEERAFLSGEVLQLLARGAAELKIDLFRDDAPRSYAPWGLDPPAFSVELRDVDNVPTILHFGRLSSDGSLDRPVEELAWTCRREGFEHVWEVTPRSVGLLTRPLDELLEYRLISAFRREIERLELVRSGLRLVLEREGREKAWNWFVSEAPLEGGAELRYPADGAAVEDALGVLEGFELGNYPGLEGQSYRPGEDELGYEVVTSRGERFRGRLGAPHREAAGGTPGRLFRFEDTELCGFAGEALAELCKRPLDDFRSLRILTFGRQSLESEVRELSFTRGGETLSYRNDGQNHWRTLGTRSDPPAAFVQAIDRGLLSPRARRWLAPDPTASLAGSDEVSVRLVTSYGEELGFALGTDALGVSYLRTEEGQRAETNPGALQELGELFGP